MLELIRNNRWVVATKHVVWIVRNTVAASKTKRSVYMHKMHALEMKENILFKIHTTKAFDVVFNQQILIHK